jgi:hypothetical protein
MGKEEALKAVTIVPAEIFGVADKVGSIEARQKANLFISTVIHLNRLPKSNIYSSTAGTFRWNRDRHCYMMSFCIGNRERVRRRCRGRAEHLISENLRKLAADKL